MLGAAGIAFALGLVGSSGLNAGSYGGRANTPPEKEPVDKIKQKRRAKNKTARKARKKNR